MAASRDGTEEASAEQGHAFGTDNGNGNGGNGGNNGNNGASTTDMPEMHVDERTGIVRFGGSQDAHYQVLRMFAEEFLPDVRVQIKAHHVQQDYEAEPG